MLTKQIKSYENIFKQIKVYHSDTTICKKTDVKYSRCYCSVFTSKKTLNSWNFCINKNNACYLDWTWNDLAEKHIWSKSDSDFLEFWTEIQNYYKDKNLKEISKDN